MAARGRPGLVAVGAVGVVVAAGVGLAGFGVRWQVLVVLAAGCGAGVAGAGVSGAVRAVRGRDHGGAVERS
ncbi:hypothetical protein GCM10010435_49540 [Winogradskya consettensis]|uniref:Uncharacterized protein n=1 Tax=Winogradskya consettensis TaxID=113560 RepID=A0A919SWY6_9ACTN|nr:hypothetical protein Aco04nite_68460 [Actinoplanes consettensis]